MTGKESKEIDNSLVEMLIKLASGAGKDLEYEEADYLSTVVQSMQKHDLLSASHVKRLFALPTLNNVALMSLLPSIKKLNNEDAKAQINKLLSLSKKMPQMEKALIPSILGLNPVDSLAMCKKLVDSSVHRPNVLEDISEGLAEMTKPFIGLEEKLNFLINHESIEENAMDNIVRFVSEQDLKNPQDYYMKILSRDNIGDNTGTMGMISWKIGEAKTPIKDSDKLLEKMVSQTNEIQNNHHTWVHVNVISAIGDSKESIKNSEKIIQSIIDAKLIYNGHQFHHIAKVISESHRAIPKETQILKAIITSSKATKEDLAKIKELLLKSNHKIEGVKELLKLIK